MAKVTIPEDFDYNKACPDVYISYTNMYTGNNNKKFFKTRIEILNKNYLSIENDYVLKNTFVYFFCNNKLVLKKQLNELKKDKNGNLFEEILYQAREREVSIVSYCGNDYINGDKISEDVFSENKIYFSSYNNKKYNFISKNKNLQLLQRIKNIKFSIDESAPNFKDIQKNCFISLNKQKKAKIAYLFDLDKFFLKNSKIYRTLKSTKIIDNIYKKIKISPEDIVFYKKNKSKNNNEYQKINSTTTILKLSSDPKDQKYILMIDDDNEDLNNFNKYDLKINIYVKDVCKQIIKEDFLDNIDYIKKFILDYKSKFYLLSQNHHLKDHKIYFFENIYKDFFSKGSAEDSELVKVVHTLSTIFSLTANTPINDYYSLFCSIFNPLVYDEEAMEYLIESINNLEKFYNKFFIFDSKIKNSTNYNVKNINSSIEVEINLKDQINYNYNSNYGYDVISSDEYIDENYKDNAGLKIISSEQFTKRIKLELNKYFLNFDSNRLNQLQTFSISSYFLNDLYYYTLNLENNTIDNLLYKQLFVKLSEFNNSDYKYDYLESIYQQLSDSGLYVKTIGAGKNSSKNKLIKNIIFDRNLDSGKSSYGILNGTGIQDIYFALSKYKYRNPPLKNYFKDSSFLSSKTFNVKNESTNYTVNKDSIENVDNKSILIFFYESFFINNLLFSGDSFDVYRLIPTSLNRIISNKMCFFNKFYIVQKKQQQEINEELYPFYQELLSYDVPSIYLNRKIEKYNNSKILEML